MTDKDPRMGPNKAEHQRRAAEALRENLRRRKERQRRPEPAPTPSDESEASD
jgi:hypothetical protein